MNENRRKHFRLEPYLRIYDNVRLWGLIKDVSQSGMRVIINKKNVLDPLAYPYEIHIPKNEYTDEFSLTFSPIWAESSENFSTIDVGGYFSNLDEEKSKKLDRLIDLIKNKFDFKNFHFTIYLSETETQLM